MVKGIDRDQFEALIGIGFNASEARLYLGLLTRHDFSATELAKYAKLSRPAAYDVLYKMIRLGICKEKPGKVKKFMAISPIEALSRYIEHQAEAQKIVQENRKQKIGELTPVLEAAFQLGRGKDDPLDYFELLRDRKQVKIRIMALQSQVNNEILTFVKLPLVLTPEENAGQYDLIKRGIIQKCIYEYDGDYSKIIELIKQAHGAGADVRICRALPIKMRIYDSKTCLFALSDPISGKASTTTLCITHKDFSTILRKAFESYWAESIPFKDLYENPSLAQNLI